MVTNHHSYQSTPATIMDDSAFPARPGSRNCHLVEGTDDLTGSAIQTRHSYNFFLAWNKTFVPCVYPYTSDRDGSQGRLLSFFRRKKTFDDASVCGRLCTFHDTEPAPVDCDGGCHTLWNEEEQRENL
jgi:hypothetical protein